MKEGGSDNILYIVSDYIAANKAKEYFEALVKTVRIFVANTDCFLYKKAQSSANNIQRVKTLFNMFTKKENVILHFLLFLHLIKRLLYLNQLFLDFFLQVVDDSVDLYSTVATPL